MLDTIGLILSAAIFAAPMRASGSVNAIFEAVKKVAKTPTQFIGIGTHYATGPACGNNFLFCHDACYRRIGGGRYG